MCCSCAAAASSRAAEIAGGYSGGGIRETGASRGAAEQPAITRGRSPAATRATRAESRRRILIVEKWT